jgi:acyl-homoserine lactone acylase PvdQ
VDRLRRYENDEVAIVAEVIEFARRARLLQHILDPAQENDDAVRTALQRLAAWGGQISYPDSNAVARCSRAWASRLRHGLRAGRELPRAGLAPVVGANDVTNPAARRPGNAISGRPILDVDKARSVIVIKRSMAMATPAWTTSCTPTRRPGCSSPTRRPAWPRSPPR